MSDPRTVNSQIARYRKKPVEVLALSWDGGETTVLDRFLGRNWGRADAHDVDWLHVDDGEQLVIWNTLEQTWIPCPVGHVIVRGIKGEFYPVEGEVFADSYEKEEFSE